MRIGIEIEPTKVSPARRGRTVGGPQTGDIRALRRRRGHTESHLDSGILVHAASRELPAMNTWHDKNQFQAHVLQWADKLDVRVRAHLLAE